MSQRAGAARRLAASLYESLLLAAVALVVGFALLPIVSPASPAVGRPLPVLTPVQRAISFGSLFVTLGVYCVWGWSGGRRTLAMKTWRIAMETTSGRRVDVGRAGLRYIAWWIGPTLTVAAYALLRPSGYGRWAVALLAVNYAWAVLSADRQFLHDRVAGTRLIVVS